MIFTKEEFPWICEVLDIPQNEMRACYSESGEKDAFCDYFRDMAIERHMQLGSAVGINERIRADIQERKAA